jgi:AcrR family transcriptional regulator
VSIQSVQLPYRLYDGSIATPTSKPLQPSQAERRAGLVRHFVTVLEPVLEGGEAYADLSVERLITLGGVSRATFYAYFDDKGHLLSAMAADVIGELVETGRHWWDLPGDADRAALARALGPPVDSYRRHRAILGAVADAAAYDPRVRAEHGALVSGVVTSLTAHIRAAQRAGTACPDLDPARTAAWIIWMHERGLQQLVSPADDAEARRLRKALTAVVWRPLYDGYR